MTDLSQFDPSSPGNPHNNIFGLPFSEEDAQLVILPVPWEVTVSCNAGTARAADHIFKASMHIDLLDADYKDVWKKGIHMLPIDKKILIKSDYLRKEAELYIDYIAKGGVVEENSFMCKSMKDINEGALFLNDWVYQQTKLLLDKNKLVGLLGGDHSTPFGFFKAIAEKHGKFGILQIDAHCDLRNTYEGFKYSHASVMYNALNEIPELTKLVQLGVRDFCDQEWNIVCDSNYRIVTYFDKDIKERMYEGQTWKHIADELVYHLPSKVYISFDIDGLDPKLCPNSGMPVPGGFEIEQLFYLFKKIIQSGRKIIGFDLNEVGVGVHEWDANVGARVLYRLCNVLLAGN